jgi:DNA-binding XRE family transcriptional regulator
MLDPENNLIALKQYCNRIAEREARSSGALKMEDKDLSSDAYQWMYDRYIKDDPDAQAFLKEVRIQADLAAQVYHIRNKLHMTQGDLAAYSGLTAMAIDDIEESDYDGDWEEAIELINRAFRLWFESVIVPAARMTEEEYSVKAVSA